MSLKVKRLRIFQTLVASLAYYHRWGGLTFAYVRQPHDWFFMTILVVGTFDTLKDVIMLLFIDYQEHVFLFAGDVGTLLLGDKYQHFSMVIFFKAIGVCGFYNHFSKEFGWIIEIDAKVEKLAPRIMLNNKRLKPLVKLSWRLISSYHLMLLGCASPVIGYQVFVVYTRLPFYQLIPSIVSSYYCITMYVYMQNCFLGEYYLMLSYCVELVREVDHNFKRVIRTKGTPDELNQTLIDFEIVCECLKRVNEYARSIYLIYLVLLSGFIPIILFTVFYVDIVLFFKFFLLIVTLYLLVLISFMSYKAGKVDFEIEEASDAVYEEILLKRNKSLWLAMPDLRYKLLKFQNQIHTGIGLSIMGHRINLSTCITLATVYITIFSLLIGSHKSVEKGNIVQE